MTAGKNAYPDWRAGRKRNLPSGEQMTERVERGRPDGLLGVTVSPCHRHCIRALSGVDGWGSEKSMKCQVEKEPALDFCKPGEH